MSKFLLFHKIANLLLRFFFFFNDTATTEIYTLSLHDALPICHLRPCSLLSHCSSRSAGRASPRSRPSRGTVSVPLSSRITPSPRQRSRTVRCCEPTSRRTRSLPARPAQRDLQARPAPPGLRRDGHW